MKSGRIFFEPWGLGDAIIAAAVMREAAGPVTLACQPRWHALLRAALSPAPDFLPVELTYTHEPKQSRFGSNATGSVLPAEALRGCRVLNIRGDPRDWWAARKLFPGARIYVNGWGQFLPHYAGWADFFFAKKILSVRNRYRAWAALAEVTFAQLELSYRQRQAQAPQTGPVVVHIGAYRRSRQYPHVDELRRLLAQAGHAVELVAGARDVLPERIEEADVVRVVDGALVSVLRRARCVISNDSGPMHLAALLGCRTLALCRVTNIHEWIPPATAFIASPEMPSGYQMDGRYRTDEVLGGWPGAAEVVEAAGRLLSV